MFKQCDLTWANEQFGPLDGPQATICDEGDLLTTIAMVLNGRDFRVDGQVVTPSTLNKFIRKVDGYIKKPDGSGYFIDFKVMQKFGFVSDGVARTDVGIRKAFRNGEHVLLQMDSDPSPRWALLTGLTSQSYQVNDPYPNSSSMINPRVVNFGQIFLHPKCRGYHWSQVGSIVE